MERAKGQLSAVVTGATSEIGLATAKGLAAQGFLVIGVGKNEGRCRRSATDLKQSFPDASVRYIVADLSLQRVVSKLAREIGEVLEGHGRPHLDVLINNAATVSTRYTTTSEGHELQFAVNRLAPFRLTYELFPGLMDAPEARVITVTSRSHRHARIRWNDVNLRGRYHLLRAFAADPGLVKTELGLKNTRGIANLIWSLRRRRGTTAERAAETLLHLSTDPREPLDGECY